MPPYTYFLEYTKGIRVRLYVLQNIPSRTKWWVGILLYCANWGVNCAATILSGNALVRPQRISTSLGLAYEYKFLLTFSSDCTQWVNGSVVGIFLLFSWTKKLSVRQTWAGTSLINMDHHQIQAWTSNYIHYEMWNEIIDPVHKFNCVTVEVWE